MSAPTTITLLRGQRVVLAVSGSIAAYKAADLASTLTQAGAHVDVILTRAAAAFVTSLTFAALTGRPVYDDLWHTAPNGGLPTHIAHVGLAEGAALLAVVPATAHTLARLAAGFADDLLGVTALATRAPLLLAPAMDGSMMDHPAVQANLATLTARGAHVVPPEAGRFASGLHGVGRLPPTPTLIGHIRRVLGAGGALAGRHVVVSAGGTREPLDPVRVLTNRSSGKQGHALAQAAIDAGARVTLVTAADGLAAPVGAHTVPVETAQQLHDAVLAACADADALIMAAAVADYRPAAPSATKLKKDPASHDAPTVPLARNPDVLLAVRAQRDQTGLPRVVVGFAAETDDLLAHAADKLARKGLDLLVANTVGGPASAFGADDNQAHLLAPQAPPEVLPRQSKSALAERVIAEVARRLG